MKLQFQIGNESLVVSGGYLLAGAGNPLVEQSLPADYKEVKLL
jgi:hypothetical protein